MGDKYTCDRKSIHSISIMPPATKYKNLNLLDNDWYKA